VEYTVNIAVVTDGMPLLGIIGAPGLGDVWRGIVGRGADRLSLRQAGDHATAIHTRPLPAESPVTTVSRSHLDARTKAYVDALPGAKLLECGSSIKFCRVAEGAADIYPRLAPTHDWDIAAGHAILAAAGGSMTAPDGSPIVYGSKELKVPAFLAFGDPARAKYIKG
jgi:3'(2'), 5'-bisphosphate nucleotidase